MAQVYPFPAYRYNASKVAYDRVLTQPYDKISPAMQDKYYAADPHNLIAIEKGRAFPGDTPAGAPNEKNVYTRAADALQDWIREQIVVPDTRPCFYSYTQEYTVPGAQDANGKGQRLTRRGFIGAGKLEEYSAGVVFRHEHTLSGPKADRLELLRHTQTHTGQLFLLYSDPDRVIDKILAQAESEAAPATELTDEYNVIHRLWVVWQPERIDAIHKAMADQKLVIADGHHRYETALNYRNERRKENAREHNLPASAEAYDATAASPPLAAAAGAATATEHVEGASASIATATAASLATGAAATNAPTSENLSIESAPYEAAPFERAMMTFVNTRSEGLTILPTHRVVANIPDFSWAVVRRYLEPWFAAETFSFTDDKEKSDARQKFLHRLVEARASRAIGVYPAPEKPGQGAYYVLTLRPGANLAQLLPNVSPLQRELDVVLLHDGILEPALGVTLAAATAEKNLTYEREASAALDAVDRRAAQVAFLLNACGVDQTWNVATSGEVMPQKSTDFFPKLMSGITMYRV
ncbi:MAG TPA: DUF1015 domain-containing protein [Candidatus Sulfotelmatobacter sp.]|nr:DUF1015 domain-containing protein [Candidatus Sulfotelmatobacter sp.]